MNKNISLSGEHIRLRPMTEADLPLKVQWYNDPNIRKTLIIDEVFDLEKTSQWFGAVKDSQARLDMMIETLDGLPIGITGFVDIDASEHVAEIFIVIGEKEFWAKGLMYEAHRLLIDWGFNTLLLRRIIGIARIDNIGSIVTMKKLGFRLDSIQEKEKNIDGMSVDIYQYVLDNAATG